VELLLYIFNFYFRTGINYFVADGVALGLQASAFFGVTQVKNNFLMYSITLKSSLGKL
jgi:hypothetical protein